MEAYNNHWPIAIKSQSGTMQMIASAMFQITIVMGGHSLRVLHSIYQVRHQERHFSKKHSINYPHGF